MTAGDSKSSHKRQVILVTGGYDHTLKLWQAHSGDCMRTMQHPECQVNALEITPDNLMVAAGGFQHIRMYDLTTANPDPVVNFNGATKNISRVGFQADGKWMYTGGEDGSACLWDLRSRQLQCQRIFKVGAPVTAIALHPNQTDIMVGDQSGCIHLWDIKTDSNDQLIPEPESSIQDIAIDVHGKLMAAVTNKGSCFVWTLSGGWQEESLKPTPRKQLQAHKKYALRCKFSSDGGLLVTTSGDCSARVWKTSDWTLLKEFKHEAQRWVWDASFSADSKFIVTGSSDSYARLWNLETGALEREYCGHQKAITALAFRDDKV